MNASIFFSSIALLFSVYSVWETSLKRSALTVFVAPVIRYASPYQNSSFEAFAIPITITNSGARVGTVMALALEVSDPANSASKRFFGADLGQWSIEKARKGDFQPFAPIPLPGRSSHTDTIIFHPRSEETVQQIVQAPGRFQFTLTLDVALSEDFGFIDRFWHKAPSALRFEMVLPELDHRAFTSGSGTVALHQQDWQSSVQRD